MEEEKKSIVLDYFTPTHEVTRLREMAALIFIGHAYDFVIMLLWWIFFWALGTAALSALARWLAERWGYSADEIRNTRGWIIGASAVISAVILNWYLNRKHRVEFIWRDENGDETIRIFNPASVLEIQEVNAYIKNMREACAGASKSEPVLLTVRRGRRAVTFDGRSEGVRKLILAMPPNMRPARKKTKGDS